MIEYRQAAFQLIKPYPADPAAGDVSQFTGQRGTIESTLLPADYTSARNFPVIGGVLTVAALLSMERRRKIYGEISTSPVIAVS